MLGGVKSSLLLLSRDTEHAKGLEDEEEGNHVGGDPCEDGEDSADLS